MHSTFRYSHRLAAVLFVAFDISFPGGEVFTMSEVQKLWAGKPEFVKTVFHRLVGMNLLVVAQEAGELISENRYRFSKSLKQSVKAWRRKENKHYLMPV